MCRFETVSVTPIPARRGGGGGEEDEDDKRDRAPHEQCCSDWCKRSGMALVQPEQQTGGDGEVQRQIRDAEDSHQGRRRLRCVLHTRLQEYVQALFE